MVAVQEVRVIDDFREVELEDPPLILAIAVPMLTGLADTDIQDTVNQYMFDVVTRTEQGFIRDVRSYLDEFGEVEGPPSGLSIFYEARTVTPELLSIRFDDVTFFQGAANPSSGVTTITADLTTGEMLFLEDLFIGSEWAFALDFIVREAVIDQLYAGDATELDAWVEPEALLIPEEFVLGPDGFEFVFQEFDVGPGVFGAPTITVPYDAIGVYIDPEGILAPVLSG